MVVEQVAFDIPAKTLEKLLSGEWIRYGGVVRNAAGQIVEHLTEVSVPDSSSADRIMQALTSRKGLVIIGSVATAATAATAWLYKRHQDQQAQLEPFRLAMVAYVTAIQTQSMSLEVVDDLLAALREVDPKRAKKVQADTIEIIVGYTREFAAANGTEIVESNAGKGKVIDLLPYLEKQRDILSDAS